MSDIMPAITPGLKMAIAAWDTPVYIAEWNPPAFVGADTLAFDDPFNGSFAIDDVIIRLQRDVSDGNK